MSALAFSGENLLHALAGAGDGERPGHGVPWLDALRERALGRFRSTGLPTPREEAWKYTNVGPLARRTFHPPPAAMPSAEVDAAVARASRGLDAAERMVFVNGRHAPRLSSTPRASGIETLAGTLVAAPAAVEPYLARHVDPAAGGFASLSAAFFDDGAFLRIAPGADRLVHIVHVLSGGAEAVDTVALPRHLIVLEPASRATVVETFLSADAGGHCCTAATEIVLGAGATLEHYRVQAESDATYHIGTVEASVDEGAHYVSHQVGIGARMSRTDVNVRLDGERAMCTLNGIGIVDGRRHCDFHTRIDHLRPHGTSRELFKTIVDGHGRGVFNGQVHVHPDAQRTDSTQANHNLLLSRDAEVDTKPELQIFADDVRCSHGATVGQLDESMLFYLRSRGLDVTHARAILTLAFAHDVLRQMALPGVRAAVVGALTRVLPSVHGLVPEEILAET